MKKVLVNCYEGIGDSIYARPFIKQLCEDGYDVYLKTVLPELFDDLPVKFIDPGTVKFRTQLVNFSKTAVEFLETPPVTFDRTIFYRYGPNDLKKYSIFGCMEQSFGYDVGSMQPKMDLSSNLPPHELDVSSKKIAIIRPPTVRKEFFCSTRLPLADYVAWCARILKDSGYYVISIADCVEGQEWIDGDEPYADLKLHHGELGLYKTLSLIKDASVVVGGSGFIVPAALAANVPLFTIFGGRGAYDNPHKIFDLRMDLKKVGWAIPDNFCRCDKQIHECDKTITNLDDKFFQFMKSIL
jgi:ADP-heptose:LPS heptosyltransferase